MFAEILTQISNIRVKWLLHLSLFTVIFAGELFGQNEGSSPFFEHKIYFFAGSDSLHPSSKPLLDSLGQMINQSPQSHFQVSYYHFFTDSESEKRANQRAKSILNALFETVNAWANKVEVVVAERPNISHPGPDWEPEKLPFIRLEIPQEK